MRGLFEDLRYGFRLLTRNPGFTILATLTLALGIGANTAIFSLINAVLLRPLPYPNPDGLVNVSETFPTPNGRGRGSLCLPRFAAWREQNAVFDGLALYAGRALILMEGDAPQRLDGVAVTSDLFRILGVEPALGRTFTGGEDRPGSNRVAVLSHGLWQRRFGSNPGIVGQTIPLKDGNYTVIGVMPSAFRFPLDARAEIWVPFAHSGERRGGHDMHSHLAVARLKPGVMLAQGRSQMETVTANLEKGIEARSARGVQLHSLLDDYVGSVKPVLWLLAGAVGFVLLIACANVSNLLLARAASRQSEAAIRVALGAGRGRLVRQFLTESLLLSVLGTALGLAFAVWTIGLLKLSPFPVPRLRTASIDMTVLGFCVALSVAAAVAFGLLPAFQASRVNLRPGLARSGSRHLRSALVVAEVGATLMLLIGAGLMLRSLLRLQSVDPGFPIDHLLTMRIPLPEAKYADNAAIVAFYQQLLGQVGTLPGVRATGLVSRLPPNDWGSNGSFDIRGRPEAKQADKPFSEIRFVSGNYFSAMGIPLLCGRSFTAQDRRGSPCVVVISETMAKRYWPAEDPLGAEIDGPDGWCAVVGVAGAVRNLGLAVDPRPERYYAYSQYWNSWRLDSMYLVVRTQLEPAGLIRAVRAEVQKLDPGQQVMNVRTMEQAIGEGIAQPRFRALAIGAFAVLALLLAMVGLYGVISYEVTQRSREIGIRMALGAGRHQVLSMVLGRGLRLAVCGVALGVAGALALTKVVATFLFGISPTDGPTFAALALLVTAIALLASYIPARRATRVDPMAALRWE